MNTREKRVSAGTVALDVRDLHMRYGTKDVLSGVSFTARCGEVVALLGPNGAGKTTTIEILEGFRMRSAGEVSVLGVDPARGDETWRARIGVVLQSWRDHARWRVRELLDYLARFYAPFCDRHGATALGCGRAHRGRRPDRACDGQADDAVRRAAASPRRRDRDRGASRSRLPGRADGGLRSACTARVSRLSCVGCPTSRTRRS